MKDITPVRAYNQTARARSAAETGERIIEAFIARVQRDWFEQVRLEDIAADAGVTVQTVIRRFGGKESLLQAASVRLREEFLGARNVVVAEPGRALDTILAEYETRGELVLRLLAQEDRFPAIRALTDEGRKFHRAWVGEVFAPWLSRLAAGERRQAHDMLVIALDLYTWKLARLDMGRSRQVVRLTMLRLCAAALSIEPAELEVVHGP